MGHIGAGGVDAHFKNQAGGRNPRKQKLTSTQDPDMDVSPLLRRGDSFSSFTGKDTGFSSSKANVAARYNGDNQPVCKREAFYVVEVSDRASLNVVVHSSAGTVPSNCAPVPLSDMLLHACVMLGTTDQVQGNCSVQKQSGVACAQMHFSP